MADEVETPAAEAEEPTAALETVRIAYRGTSREVRCGGRLWVRNQPQDVDAECAAIVLTNPAFRRVKGSSKREG